MIDQINKLIAINLFLLFASENESLSLKEFKNEKGNQLPGAKMLAEIMEQKELIKLKSEEELNYELTNLGQYIAERGGWLVYLEKQKKQSNNYQLQDSNKKNKELFSGLIIATLIIVVLSLLIVSCI